MSKFRQPVVAISHGVGPLWMLDEGYIGLDKHLQSAKSVADIFEKIYTSGTQLPIRILLVSVHWEARSRGLEICSSAAPDMFYDYSGLPAESYEFVYGAKGDPALAARDNISIVTMSINDRMLNAKDHFELGRALSPLWDEDTLIITSGQATHNMSADWFPEDHPVEPWALEFQSWLDKTLSVASAQSYKERMDSIVAWKGAPNASICHALRITSVV